MTLGPFTSQDASYSTYYALLFFIYTETITFAPLTSSFLHQTSSLTPTYHSSHQHTSSTSTYRSVASTQPSERWSPRKARREWIDEWCQLHPGRPRPPSAKSIYVLADKMGLGVLKKKAFDREFSLCPQIAGEVFRKGLTQRSCAFPQTSSRI